MVVIKTIIYKLYDRIHHLRLDDVLSIKNCGHVTLMVTTSSSLKLSLLVHMVNHIDKYFLIIFLYQYIKII